MCGFTPTESPSGQTQQAQEGQAPQQPMSRREMLLGYMNRRSAPQQQRAPRIGFAQRLAQSRASRPAAGTAATNLIANRLTALRTEQEALAAQRQQWQAETSRLRSQWDAEQAERDRRVPNPAYGEWGA